MFSSREIENLLKKKVILQNILVSKPPDSYRLILDLKKKKIKEAYCSIPILEYHQSSNWRGGGGVGGQGGIFTSLSDCLMVCVSHRESLGNF